MTTPTFSNTITNDMVSDCALWQPNYIAPSSWLEHLPFAFWVIAAAKPRMIVELGTKFGVSYFAFCQAVERLRLDTRCYAVDHWKGDEHTGEYGEQVFEQALSHNKTYSAFSTLIRSSFDEAASHFDEGTVDLIHLDGLHTEEAVRQDVATWLPKLSSNGLLLLHDTNVRERGFGVYKVFAELEKQYPAFQFYHGHGLGVIAVGPNQSDDMRAFFQMGADGASATRMRESFARVGQSHLDRYLLDIAARKQRKEEERATKLSHDVSSLRKDAEIESSRRKDAEKENTRLKQAIFDLETELEEKKATIKRVNAELTQADGHISDLKTHIDSLKKHVRAGLMRALDTALSERDAATGPLAALLRQRRSGVQTILKGARMEAVKADRRFQAFLFFHYRLIRKRRDAGNLARLATSGLFDPLEYLKRYEDVAKSGVDPLIHYVDFGAAEGRSPSSLFDSGYYIRTNPDVAAEGVNPLLHFINHGEQEGRRPRSLPEVEGILGDWKLPQRQRPRLAGRSPKNIPRRIVIYTAVTGGYDQLKPPKVRPPNCDFVVFSDERLNAEGWEVRPLNFYHRDPTYAARFVKLHPHLYFPEYDHSIWIDANIAIEGDARAFLDALTDDSFLGIFAHPLRDCIYVEAEECIKREKDDPETIRRHIARYREQEFPEKAGLWETNVLARRHNDAACFTLMTAWWRELATGSRRDQISLPVVAHRLSANIVALGDPGSSARQHPLVSLSKHPPRQTISRPAPPSVRQEVDIEQIPIDIGVCVYNSPDETKACIESLLAAKRPIDRILLVDDASQKQTAELLDHFVSSFEGVELFRNPENRGYTRSANEVLKWSKSPWIVLLNSDTEVPRRALPKLVACGEQFPRLGIVGPLSNAGGWQTVPTLTGPDGKFLVNKIPASLTLDDMDQICEEASTGIIPFVPLINGFCFAIRRSLVDRIGLFDEENFPIGYGEEDDFCLRAGEAGFMCGIATDSYVFHRKTASFTSAQRLKLVESGAKALRTKHTPEWLAAAVEHLRRNPYLEQVRQRIGERLAPLDAIRNG